MIASTQQADRSAAALSPALQSIAFVFDALPLGVFLFDARLHVCYQNELARCMFAEGDDLAAALTRDVVDSRFESWKTHLDATWSRTTPQRFDGLRVQSNGLPARYVNATVSTLSDPAGGGVRLGLLLLEDVTPHFTMEQRLAVSERLAAVGKLCASVAHELNNPLDGILRFLNLALRVSDGAANPKLYECVSAARDGCMRLVHIVRALLDFSRNAPPALAEQTLSRLIDEAVRTFEARAAERQIAIFCRYPQADVTAVGGVNLFQVFCNLIKNAIDAMPAGGSLTISGEQRGGEVVISFVDSGCGLPKDAERLFEPFFTTKPAGQGTGLGLAVCKEIVERLGGSISAGNRSDGPGAVFTIRIPCGFTGLVHSKQTQISEVSHASQ